jgi:transposase
MGRDSPSLWSSIVTLFGQSKSSPRTLPKPGSPGVQIQLRVSQRRRFKRTIRTVRDGPWIRRYQAVLLRDLGQPYRTIAKVTGFSLGWVTQILRRFETYGEAGLVDRREDNGDLKADETFLSALYAVLEKTAPEWGWARPTWTREMLSETLAKDSGVRVSLSTMSRALLHIGARRGRPKPIGICPWSKAQKARRLRKIRRLLENLPADEVAFWSDEVDVNLNPKIGPDWMLRGQQRRVATPGNNTKRYIAGALHAKTRRLRWVWGERRNSRLFIDLILDLCRAYRRYRVIHLIVDNAGFHKPEGSKQTARTLEALGGRVQLHYLPTYSPDDNPIERLWEDFHAEVTRNHQCPTIESLMDQADDYLQCRNAAHLNHSRAIA